MHHKSFGTKILGVNQDNNSFTGTEDIGYYDYLGTRGKNSHRQIIVTGRYRAFAMS